MLTGQQIAQLRNALQDAYPTHAALREMVLEELHENLDAIASVSSETLRATVFSLITWAESTGRTLELIEGAYRHNDANPALREVAAALGVAVAIPTQPPAPNTRPAGGGQPSPAELRRRELQKQYDLLARQYEAASQQLQTTINAADRPLLEEQVASLAARMEAVWAQLSVLDAPTPPAPVTPPAPETVEIAVHLRMEQVYTALCDLFEAEERPLVEVVLANRTDRAQRLCASVEIQHYSTRIDKTKILAPGESATLHLLPALLREQVRPLNVITRATATVTVTDLEAGRELHQEGYPVWLLARNAAPIATRDPATGTWVDLTRYFGAFVTPDAPPVRAFLHNAAERHPKRRLEGYQGDTVSQARAIYEALKEDSGILYVDSTTSFNPDAAARDQRVRLPRESLAERLANCIDGALLFASLLEACTIDAALVISTDHAIVGWQRGRGGERWEYLETTMLATNSFADAREIGARRATLWQQQAAGDPTRFRRWSMRELRERYHITPLK